MKKIIFIYILMAVSWESLAQTPFIGSINPKSAAAGETVTITGRNFSDDPDELHVRFGGAIAEIIQASTTVIEVKAPNNAAYDNIHVTNLVTGLTATSGDKFLLSFNGAPFDVDKMDARQDFPTDELGNTDICICDFNDDGISDVAVTSADVSSGTATITVFTNNSTPSTISLSSTQFDFALSLFTICGDVDGDGKSDLIFSESQGIEIVIFRNISTGATIEFDVDNAIQLSLPRTENNDIRNIYEVELVDLDNNGKRDLIASNSITNELDIFANNSTSGNIIFPSTPMQIEIPQLSLLGPLEIQDLNNDGLKDIVAGPRNSSNAFVLTNISNENDIQLRVEEDTIKFSNLNDIKIADLDGDLFKEVLMVNNSGQIRIFKNNTSSVGSKISFTQDDLLSNITTTRSFSVGLGDIQGDGKVDLIGTSTEDNNSLSIYINNSSLGNIDFQSPVGISGNEPIREVEVVDIDGDSRPDLVFSHDVASVMLGDLSIILNKNCFQPEIYPAQDQVICSDTDLELTTASSAGTIYLWEVDKGTGFDTAQYNTDNTLTVLDHLTAGEQGIFRVTTISDGNSCIVSSSTVQINVDATSALVPSPTSNGPVCVGDDLIFDAGIDATLYEWTLPDGNIVSTSDREFTVTDFQLDDAGSYQLVVNSGSCRSEAASILVEPKSLPFIQIDVDGQNSFCVGDTKELTVTNYTDFTYQWVFDGDTVSGETTSTINITDPGVYQAVIVDDTQCKATSASVSLTQIARPIARITQAEALKCIDLPINFSAETSTPEPGFTLNYSWDFDDGSAADTNTTTQHAFATADTYQVTLTATYNEVTECFSTEQFLINVENNESYDIISSGTEKCPSDSMLLELPAGFNSYMWSTGETDNDTYAKTALDISSVDISVVWEDAAGCTGSTDITITNFPNSTLTVNPVDPFSNPIENDTITIEEGSKFIELEVAGGTDYEWSPDEIIENPTSSIVIVYPDAPQTLITVSGVTAGGECNESRTVLLINDNIVPRKTFSPNGDGQGFDQWEILNITGLDCQVTIFDSKGTILHQAFPPFDSDLVWDGNSNGTPVPDGVYYFVMKCSDNQYSRTGSILLAR